jgi:hypothetical protein
MKGNTKGDITELQGTEPARVLLAGADTVYFSFDVSISDEVREKLEKEKEAAQIAAKAGQVHCPGWLGARVLPNGARGGYGLLIETEDFSIKLLGKGIPNRPGIYLELRSYFLHTHSQGPAGACEEAICWVRNQLLYNLDDRMIHQLVSFESARLSRADIHIDWQGGYGMTLEHTFEDLRRFIRPGKTKWGFYGSGYHPTGYTFGKGGIQARLYNKSIEATEKANDAYFALLVARNKERYDPVLDVWRLEFQLKRDGAKGFKLYAEPVADDEDENIEADSPLRSWSTSARCRASLHAWTSSSST